MGVDTENKRKDIVYSELKLEELGPGPAFGARHWQCVFLFIFLFVAYGVRVTLSVAIVAMTDPSTSSNADIPTYPEWTQKGAILSAFFWGYIWPQVLAGYVANRFGAKWFLIVTMAIQSVLGVLTPCIAAQFGEAGMMVVRAMQGFCQGFFFPTVTHVLSQWVPKEERARLTSLAFGAVPSGTVAGLLVTGVIASGRYGWPMVFYLYGVLGLLWCVLFSFVGHNSPADHPSISKAEKYFIEKSLGHTEEKPSHVVPWKAIFTSVPAYALLATQCGWVFGFWMLLSQIPSYMNHVMNFKLSDNSILSALPYGVQLIVSLIFSVISDLIINSKMVGVTAVRKWFNSIGSLIPAVALVLLAYTNNDEPSRAVILLVIAVGSSAGGLCGWGINCMDLTTSHSGTLLGLCNGVSNIFAIFAPIMVQMLVKDQKDAEQWRIIFFIAAGIYVVSSTVFNIFGSGEKQPWNDDDDIKEDKEKQ